MAVAESSSREAEAGPSGKVSGKGETPVANRSTVRGRRSALVASAILLLTASSLAGCADGGLPGLLGGDRGSPRVARAGEPIRPGGGYAMVGEPYRINGRWYYPEDDPDYRATGVASWYGSDFHGRLTANGEVYNMAALTAAHPTLPLPSYARVTNLANGRSIVVRINDRGPFAEGRVIDLSQRAASALGYERAGIARVEVDYIGRAPLDGLDEDVLMASYVDPSRSTRSGRLGTRADTMLASAGGAAPTIGVSEPQPTIMLASNPAPAAIPPVPRPSPLATMPAGLSSPVFTTVADPLALLISANAYAAPEAPAFGPSEAGAAIEAFAPIAPAAAP